MVFLGEERKGRSCIIRLGWPICQHWLALNWIGLKKMGPGVGPDTVLLQCTIIKATVPLALLIVSITCDLFLEESKTTHICNLIPILKIMSTVISLGKIFHSKHSSLILTRMENCIN